MYQILSYPIKEDSLPGPATCIQPGAPHLHCRSDTANTCTIHLLTITEPTWTDPCIFTERAFPWTRFPLGIFLS